MQVLYLGVILLSPTSDINLGAVGAPIQSCRASDQNLGLEGIWQGQQVYPSTL